ncbi:MAG: hypothetical protein OQL20_11560 [Sedimenticola sp.]|nr:hypothetical protein [Sedimenticola sp.]
MIEMIKRVALLLVMVMLSLGALAAEANWQAVAEEVIVHINQAEKAYLAGEQKQAKREVVSAYFGVFEDRKMEAAMRMELGAKHTYLVEKQFGTLRKAIQKDAGADEIAQIAEAIRVAMRRDARLLDQAGIPLEVFKVNQ